MTATRIHTVPNGPTYLLPASLYEYFTSCDGGEPEHSLILWVKENFLHRDWAVVDIGAHVGTYTLHLAPHCRAVYAFEPQRSTYHRLAGGVALSGHDNIHTFHTAIGDTSGRADLRRQGDEGGLSTITQGIPHALNYPIEEVPQNTLDSYGLERVGLIKIDVEGNELAVLRGARQTLEASGWPRLLVEVWTDAWFATQREAVRVELNRLGYALSPINNYPHMILATHTASTVKP